MKALSGPQGPYKIFKGLIVKGIPPHSKGIGTGEGQQQQQQQQQQQHQQQQQQQQQHLSLTSHLLMSLVPALQRLRVLQRPFKGF